jgi:hypothetical protein
MASTYTLIEKITVPVNGSNTVSFSNIPQNYTDLVLKISARTLYQGGADGYFFFQDGSGTSNYNWKKLQGYGTGTSSYGATGSGTIAGLTLKGDASSNAFSNIEVYIPNYTSSNYKSTSSDIVSENNGSAGYTDLVAGMWTSTSPITSITFYVALGWAYNSTFYLYGVSKASATITGQGFPYATGGDIIQTDGTYWYHAFLSSGTFTTNKNALSCDLLTVAGGGAGGQYFDGGGGGAGGLLYTPSQTLPGQTTYTVLVGAGGAAGGDLADGFNGSNSSFTGYNLNLVGIGGGGGRGYGFAYGGNTAPSGGSGGGGGMSDTNPGNVGNGGSGISGQGNAGGNAYGGLWSGTYRSNSGGGGGAGAVGVSAVSTNDNSGSGGAGVNTYSSWLTPTGLGVSGYLAGGGGGGGDYYARGGTVGSGGAGGGGAGAKNVTATSGTANTGSGGGGTAGRATSSLYAGAGGSGLVIVRYAV